MRRNRLVKCRDAPPVRPDNPVVRPAPFHRAHSIAPRRQNVPLDASQHFNYDPHIRTNPARSRGGLSSGGTATTPFRVTYLCPVPNTVVMPRGTYRRVNVTSGLLIRSVKVPAKVGRRQLARRTRLAAADFLGLAPCVLENSQPANEFADASSATTPATALQRSSWPPGAWSMLSRPPRAVRRSRPRSGSQASRSIEQVSLPGVNGGRNRDKIGISAARQAGTQCACSRKRSRGHSPP